MGSDIVEYQFVTAHVTSVQDVAHASSNCAVQNGELSFILRRNRVRCEILYNASNANTEKGLIKLEIQS